MAEALLEPKSVEAVSADFVTFRRLIVIKNYHPKKQQRGLRMPSTKFLCFLGLFDTQQYGWALIWANNALTYTKFAEKIIDASFG